MRAAADGRRSTACRSVGQTDGPATSIPVLGSAHGTGTAVGGPMNGEVQRSFTQDTLPKSGLWLDRHQVVGTRPAEGTVVVARCGRSMRVGPPPERVVAGIRLTASQPCWDCEEAAAGRRPGAPNPARPIPPPSERERLIRVKAGTAPESQRVAHRCPSPAPVAGLLRTRCGQWLPVSEVDVLASDHGMPCASCLVTSLLSGRRRWPASVRRRRPCHRWRSAYRADAGAVGSFRPEASSPRAEHRTGRVHGRRSTPW
ncbi:hypothetical protein FHR81_004552 [Actinoalloteichus hoggarensis]|uniref:Uncharacterized protein n=1 Tax=Actinoalloteichus hoggarensis TaxID=1470176 RepID=A0A221W3K3_9PSEU|nr:hypothetical protein AHOG_13995 [Actinoalloteichus hoggarensis]MBB5923481.1 hypothetical protein [Actinoalloteichus hoggarensis]